jgi:hypothetical protein
LRKECAVRLVGLGDNEASMALICPQCSRSFEDETQCPRCAIPLEADTPRDDPDDPLPPHWSRNPWGRILLGVMLAQGLFFIIREFALAGYLVTSEQLTGRWALLSELLTLQGFQLGALLAGSVLAGAGQKNGPLYGAFVGLWNGILSVLFQAFNGPPLTVVDFYSQPMIHAAVGGLGGVLGTWIWKPPCAYLRLPGAGRGGLPSAEFLAGVMAGQISWFRVLLGTVVAVVGVMFAETILQFVLRKSEGAMTIRTTLQQDLMTYEIKILAVFFGGAISGTSTWNGTVQGLWVGLLSAALVVGVQMGRASTFDLNHNILVAGSVLFLSTIGGAFGGKLLPPVVKYNRRRFKPVPI